MLEIVAYAVKEAFSSLTRCGRSQEFEVANLTYSNQPCILYITLVWPQTKQLDLLTLGSSPGDPLPYSTSQICGIRG